jgi:hypothetical protein
MIKEIFERRKNDSRFVEERDIILYLRIFRLVLFPNLTGVISLKVHDFIKYTSLEWSNTHLQSYFNKIVEVIHDDKILIYFFQDSLIGFALS